MELFVVCIRTYIGTCNLKVYNIFINVVAIVHKIAKAINFTISWNSSYFKN